MGHESPAQRFRAIRLQVYCLNFVPGGCLGSRGSEFRLAVRVTIYYPLTKLAFATGDDAQRGAPLGRSPTQSPATFGRIIGFDDRVTGCMKMLRRVPIGRLITAADMTAGSADTQMQPWIAE
jgi:hypothetical protein